MTSNLSAFNFIQERSEATPGLWNNPFSVLSANIAAVDSNVTFTFPSIETLSLFTNLDASGNLHAAGRIGLGPTPSAVTTGMLTIAVSSALSDYIHFEDTSGARSNYLLGSRVGGTADGLNLWDLSGDTMIASFSKQSVRFFQNVVGPVFDVGGALADTLNAATFGTGADSDESRIQAAISAASTAVPVISRVYIPANMYPYSAASVSFETRVQMVREGGAQTVYDVKAYGATGDGAVNDYHAVQQAINAAAANLGICYIPQGRFKISSKLTIPSDVEITGAGQNAKLVFAWFFASGATSGGATYLQNADTASGNSRIRIHDFAVEGENTDGGPTVNIGVGAGAFLFRRGGDINVYRVRITNIPGISIAYQGVTNCQFADNYLSGGGRDGITGGPFDTSPCQDIVVSGNIIGPIADDGIALNASVDQAFPGTVLSRLAVIGNTIFGASAFSTGMAGRGIIVHGADDFTVVGNSIASTYAQGISINWDEVNFRRCQWFSVTGNTVVGAGQAGDGAQSPHGIDIGNSDYGTVTGNAVSMSSSGGINVDGATHLSLVGNSVVSNGRQITNFGIAVGSSSTCSFIVVDGNNLYSNAGAGVYATQVNELVIANNTIIDNGSVGTGALIEGAGILLQSRAYNVRVLGNTITDTRAAANKTQSWGIRGNSVSLATLYIHGNRVSGNSANMSITGTPKSLWMYGNDDHEVQTANVVGWWSPSAFTAGTALLPGMSFASEVSLGLYRSAASTMALSYGTMLTGLLSSTTIRATGPGPTPMMIPPSTAYGWTGLGHRLASAAGAASYSSDAVQFDLVVAPATTVKLLLCGGSASAPALLSLTTLNDVRMVYGQLLGNSGSSIRPTYAFSSISSLGLYSSGAATIAQSTGTFNLATNAVNLSMATLAAATSAVDKGLAVVFRASGLSLIYKSGSSIYDVGSGLSGTA